MWLHLGHIVAIEPIVPGCGCEKLGSGQEGPIFGMEILLTEGTGWEKSKPVEGKIKSSFLHETVVPHRHPNGDVR